MTAPSCPRFLRVSPWLARSLGSAVLLGFTLTTRSAEADESGTLPTAINVPSGPGSIEGFGQGYQLSPSTGLPGLGYALPLPPGRAGLEPELRLQYDAGGSSGILGLGWSLSIPRIEFSTRQGMPAFDGGDLLRLEGLGSGEDLVQVEPGVFGERFGADTPVVVVAMGDGFEARTADGTSYRFGTDASGRSLGPSGPTRWWLQQVEDLFGNTLEYQYRHADGTTEPLLDRIEWNDGQTSVNFGYEARPDVVVSRAMGYETVLAHRLAVVQSFEGGELVQQWTQRYVNTPEVPSSQLTSIASVAADGTAVPTWRMTYGAAVAEDPAPVVLSDAPQLDPTAEGHAWIDVDGDGVPDLLQGESGSFRYRRNEGGERLADWADLPRSPSFSLDAHTRFADITGDGIVDLLAQPTLGSGQLLGFAGGGAEPLGTPREVPWLASFDLAAEQVAIVDLDLDGRVDILASSDSDAFVWTMGFDTMAYGEAEVVPPLPQGLGLGEPGVVLVDMNGDRLPDLTRIMAGEGRILIAPGEGRGLFGAPVEMAGLPDMDPTDRFELRDINGDGAADLVRWGDRLDLWINRLDGGFAWFRTVEWEPLAAGEKVVFSDVNGNGTVDVLRVNPTGTSGWRYWDLLGQRPGLLAHFDNGLGYSMVLTYGSVAAQAEEARRRGKPWTSLVPMAMPVLAKSIEHDGVDWERTVEHQVRDGYFDARAGQFRGFEQVKEHRWADEYAEARVSVRRYDLGRDDEARKGQLLEERVENGDGVLVRSEHAVVVEEDALGNPTARRIATDTWSLEGEPGPGRRTRSEWTFDGWGNVIEQRELGLVDPVIGEDIPGDERFTRWTYAEPLDGMGPRDRVAEEVIAEGTGDQVRATRTYYDGGAFEGLPLGQVGRFGVLQRRQVWIEGDRWIDETRQRWDERGNVVELVDPEGGRLQRRYDDEGRFVVEERRPLENGAALVVSATWNAGLGKLTAITDEVGAVTRVAYDGLGRPTAIARPGDTLEQPTIGYRYFLDGSTDAPAIVTELRRVHGTNDVERGIDHLDGLGRLRQRITQDDEGTGAVLEESRHYDSEGEVGMVFEGQFVGAGALEPGGFVEASMAWPSSRTTRDALGRVIETVDPDGYRSLVDYAPGTTTRWDHEDLVHDSPYASTPEVTEFDGLGRVRRVEERGLEHDSIHRYRWDAAARLLAAIDPAGHETTYEHDGAGRLVLVDSPDSGILTQLFDDVGRVLERVDARGARVTWTYDRLGRVLEERGIEPDGDEDDAIVYHYDRPRERDAKDTPALGRLVGVDDAAGSIDFVHDDRGRIARTTRRFRGVEGEVTLSMGREYDPQDRVVREIHPDGATVDREYGYRGLERRVGAFVEAITRDARGRAIGIRHGNGVEQRWLLDQTGRVLEQRVRNGESTHLDLTHRYDPAGLLVKTRDRLGATAVSPALDQGFEYDDRRRLVKAHADYGTLRWHYDHEDNLLTQGGHQLEYDGMHPHAATRLGEQRLTYDDAGQLAVVEGTGVLPEGKWAFDAHGRVRRFTRADGTVVEHVHGHDGARAIKRVIGADGSLQEEVLYLGAEVEVRRGRLVRWILADGVRVAEVPGKLPKGGYPPLPLGALAIMGLGIGVIVRPGRPTGPRQGALVALLLGVGVVLSCAGPGKRDQRPDGSLDVTADTRFHIQDRLGSAALVLDKSGDVIARAAHRPYGERWIDWQADGTVAPNYRFTGKEEDVESGGIAIGARHYLPALGRWISPDPRPLLEEIQADLENPRRRHPYGYVLGNPVRAFDPDGRVDWESLKEGVASATSVALDAAGNAGWGAVDAASGGLTQMAREAVGWDPVDYDSTSYKVGYWGTTVAQAVGTGVGAVRLAVTAGRATTKVLTRATTKATKALDDVGLAGRGVKPARGNRGRPESPPQHGRLSPAKNKGGNGASHPSKSDSRVRATKRTPQNPFSKSSGSGHRRDGPPRPESPR